MMAAASPSTAGGLGPGDVRILGFNNDAPDSFAFILFANLGAGEQLCFTDKGWHGGTGRFYPGEGLITYTAPAGGLAAGTVVVVTNTVTAEATGADQGLAAKSGSFALSGNGDQITVYQVAPGGAATNFIFCLNWNGASAWNNADDAEKTAVPPGLVAGETAVHADQLGQGAEDRNGCYIGSRDGVATALSARLREACNWEFRADPAYVFDSRDAPLKPEGTIFGFR